MTDWMIAVGYSICGAMLVMTGIGIAFSAFMPALDRWNRRYFITLFSLLLLYAIVLTIDLTIFSDPDMAPVLKAVIFFEYLFFSVLIVMPMPFLLHCFGEKAKNVVLIRTAAILWGVFCIFLSVTQFSDIFYYKTSINQYTRTPLFPLMIAPLTAIMLINTICMIKRRQILSKRVFIALFIYLIPTTILIIVYMFVNIDILVSLWMSLCVITMFRIILIDNIEQYTLQQREIANQRTSVMVLQMRPHFIYNTMMSIYYLCKQDPDKAQKVTLDFTTYLRRNFAAVANETTVPFSDELQHTEAYLAVEQVQHEDSLFVSFDTPHTMFRIPPLTLQPLVENAVKHGMNPNGDPLSISVKTRQTNDGSEIIVEDNGAGFDPAKNNGAGFDPADEKGSHIALNNIRQRLEMMCKGKMAVTSRNGGGTKVIITIPKRG